MDSERKLTPPGRGISRREVLRLAAAAPLALVVTGEAAASFNRKTQDLADLREPLAKRWKPWLVSTADSIRPPRPEWYGSARVAAELRELLDLQSRRGDTMRSAAEFWDAQAGIPRWTQVMLDTIQATRINPVRAARAMALLHTAIADATICAWDAKYLYQRMQPVRLTKRLTSISAGDGLTPGYVSEHAAVAGAAVAVLNALFPGQSAVIQRRSVSFDVMASEAGLSRLWAGASLRSDVEAGMQLGQRIGALAVARAQSDGASAVWDAIAQPGRRRGPEFWEPTPPAFVFPPLEPLAGTWRAWLLVTNSQFRAPEPPALQGSFPSSQFLAEVAEVKQTVDHLTPDQRRIADFWADGGGTVTPPGHWMAIALQHVVAGKLSTPRAARALALLAVGMMDSAITCWESKFAYWVLRPVTAIRTLEGYGFHDPGFATYIATPPFPSYTSGHSTFSGCAAAVLEHLFPGGTLSDAFGNSVSFNAAAEQAAVSRLYGGIHYRSDNEAGLTAGRGVASLVIRRAQSDGAEG
jgi:hypothetical protein